MYLHLRVALKLSVPVLHIEAGVVLMIEGVVLTVAVTADLAEVQPLFDALT